MGHGGRTKAQQVGVKDPRIVFLSCTEGPFALPVRDSMRGKFRGQEDEFARPIEVLERRPGRAGDRVALLPWDPKVPTDVIVLLSDDYIPEFVSVNKIEQDDVVHHLNVVLRLRQQAKSNDEYNVWLGVVQDLLWERVGIEGASLEAFKHLIHPLLGDESSPSSTARMPKFIDDPKDKYLLDTASAFAASRVKSHQPSVCPRCNPLAIPPSTSSGYFRRWFRKVW
jgi:hypothetical protein